MTDENERKVKRKCPICGQELSEDDSICPNCGACQDEPCYDADDDLDE